MYYKRYEIDNHLMCPKCLKRYDLPIALPCGFCICESCLQELTYTQTVFINNNNEEKTNWEISCPLCYENHQVPEKNFPIQKSLAELLVLNPSKETHDIVFNEFKTLLYEYSGKFDGLKKIFNDSIDKINEHSKKMKNEISNRIEILLKLIEKYEKDVVEKLNNFENDKSKSVNDNIVGIINEINLKLSGYNLLLNEDNKNEKQKIKLATFDAIRLIESLDNSIVELNNLITDANNIDFTVNTKSFEDSIVGELILNSIKNKNHPEEYPFDPFVQLVESLNNFEQTVTEKVESNDEKPIDSDSPNLNFTANESGVACKTQ
jgi:hypothetical protein